MHQLQQRPQDPKAVAVCTSAEVSTPTCTTICSRPVAHLVQCVLQAHAFHQTPCLGVQQHDLTIQHHVVNILQIAVLRLEG